MKRKGRLRGRPNSVEQARGAFGLVKRSGGRGSWGCCCGQANVAVDSPGSDADAAVTDARPVAAMAALVDRDVWQVRDDASIHTVRIEVRVQVSRQLQFDVAVDAVQRNAFLLDALHAGENVSVDASERSSAAGARDVHLAVDAAQVNWSVDLTDDDRAVHASSRECNLARQFQSNVL